MGNNGEARRRGPSERHGPQEQPDARRGLGEHQKWMQRTMKRKMAEDTILAHPYLARQMLDCGFRQTLEVRTLGCARRSLPYRLTSRSLARNLGYTMNNTRDAMFILVRAIVVV